MTKEEIDGNQVFVIHDFLSSEECIQLIQRSENLVYEPATVADTIINSVRNNDRVLLDDPSLAESSFLRAKPFLPYTINSHLLVGFNERLRFYRYSSDQTFKPHRDGAYYRFKTREQSYLTFMVYLNDQVISGETRFFVNLQQAFWENPYLSVQPKEGMALVFIHNIWHEGAVLESGQKYLIRTDVMYGRFPKKNLKKSSL
ncbi:MAG: hypothetical protein F6K10_06540 [Moorea sp. SIO2B7]|nr:hypothetical protein [Moorena sp. SIO2B7]